MSIWVSHDHIGTENIQWKDVRTGKPIPNVAERGHVLTFAQGFSNHHPNHEGTHERPANVSVAHIPPWCVPGHDDEFDDYDEKGTVGPWLRLDVHAKESLDFWRKDDDGNPAVEELHASVVLDEAAAKALMGDLIAWLTRPKLHPREADQ